MYAHSYLNLKRNRFNNSLTSCNCCKRYRAPRNSSFFFAPFVALLPQGLIRISATSSIQKTWRVTFRQSPSPSNNQPSIASTKKPVQLRRTTFATQKTGSHRLTSRQDITNPGRARYILADREGFEPSVPMKVHLFSSQASSTTPASVPVCYILS